MHRVRPSSKRAKVAKGGLCARAVYARMPKTSIARRMTIDTGLAHDNPEQDATLLGVAIRVRG